ncbi:unnamed protein product [Enterobius vermicularis]|uniref:RING-type domain-containing protein n=1 Tax=Enterobius vermicularis TaxID=51028 RepID=A0A0N4UZH2_ENTVE|nr:unnamed protein product [Enterobius vermicularis]
MHCLQMIGCRACVLKWNSAAISDDFGWNSSCPLCRNPWRDGIEVYLWTKEIKVSASSQANISYIYTFFKPFLNIKFLNCLAYLRKKQS